ncbi:MAG: GTP-binding protein [Thermoplasmata archaeon]|nr:GTP-binding protein [Thermoplasmata archaeon]MCK5397145.1 GTP-binding protein [Thermoplasmata archaeon]
MVKKTVKKVVLLGESAVGKTSLIKRFVHDEFADDYISTIGTKVSKKVIDMNVEGQEIQVNLMIWDMLGREGYMSTQARQIVGAQGVIIVGDITRPETMANLEKYWIPLILRTIGTVKLPFIFLGNKVDLADDDSLMNTLDIMSELEERYNHGMKQYIPEHLNTWFLTSAKTGEKVEESFESMANLLFYFDRAEDPFYTRIQDVIIKGLADIGERKTTIEVLDQIMFEFSEAYGNMQTAGKIIREEVARAGIDHNNPKKEGVLALVDYLIDALVEEQMDGEMLKEVKDRWLEAIENIQD